MGLDMYLTAKRYVSDYREEDKPLHEKVKALDVPAALGKVNRYETEAAYWRKANQIHNWFVQNVQDGEDECRPHYVSVTNLRELLEACKEVLADHDKAEDLLPVQEGFFFGSYEYDDWYFEQIQDTIQQLERILSVPESELANWDFEYQSSW